MEKKYTLIFKADKPYLREMPSDKPRGDNAVWDSEAYRTHCASLPCYPLLNKPESWKEGMQIEEGMVRKEWQNEPAAQWVNCSKEVYDRTPDSIRRIIFTPSEQPEKERGWIINSTSEQVGGGGEGVPETFTFKQVDFLISKFVCEFAPHHSQIEAPGAFIHRSYKEEKEYFQRTTPAAPSTGGLGDEDKVIICLNCKAFHFFGTWVCDRCGGKTFSAAHPSNKQFIEPVPGGLELAKAAARLEGWQDNSVQYEFFVKGFLTGYASKGDGVELSQKEYNDLKRDAEQWRTHLKEIYKTK